MKNVKGKLGNAALLHQEAEELLKKKLSAINTQISDVETLKLIHELDVYQIELEMYNEELRLSKEQTEIAGKKYTDLYDFAPFGYFTLSKEGKIIELNFTGANLLGKERSLLINSPFIHFVTDDTKTIFSSFLDKVLGNRTKETCEITLSVNPDTPIYAHLTGTSIENGENHCLLSVVDITELKKEEDILRVSEEKCRTLFETNRDSITIFRINPDNKPSNFIEANPASTQIFGYTKEELMSISITGLESATGKVRKNRIETLQSKGRIDFETIIKTKNKKNRNVEVEFIKINYLNQPAVMNIIRDITERKQMEENAEKVHTNLATILDAIPDLLFEVDLDGRIYHYHSHRTDLLANPPSAFLGKLFQEVLPADVSDVIMAAILEADENGWSSGHQYALQLSQGKHWFEISASPLIGNNDKDKRFILLARNISDRKLAEEVLKQSKDKLRVIFDTANTGILTIDIHGKFLLFNNWLTKKLGYIKEEMYNLTISDITHPDDLKKSKHWLDNIIQGKFEKYQIENRFIRKDNSVFWGELSISTIKDENNAIIKIIGIISDISERKRTSNELLKLNRTYELISKINDLIIRARNRKNIFQEICNIAVNYGKFRMSWIGLLDDDNQTINVAACDGFVDDYFSKGKKILICDVPQGRGPAGISFREGRTVVCNDIGNDPMMELWREEALQRGYRSLIGIPIVVRNKTIGTFCLYSEETNFFSSKEEVELLEKITKNIAFCLETILIEEQRKSDEEKIRQLSKAVEQSPIMIVITNTMGDIEYVNPKFVEVTGYSFDEVKGQNLHFLKSGKTSAKVYKQLWQILETGKEWHGEFHNKKKNGDLYWELETISPIVNAQGKTTHFIAVKEDITDSKRAEHKLIIAKENAEENERLKSAFLANMSHEIRTPMNGILGFTELLKEPKLTGKEQQEYIRIIEKSGVRMLNIINDIISISKVESGQVEISLSKTNVNEQIEYLQTFFKLEAKQKGIQLSFTKHLTAEEASIKTDCEKLYAILTNLVKNAIKFTDAGSIEFGYVKKRKFLEFFVKDTGLGIPKFQKEIIFERFRQANDLTHQTHEGSGLGLAISKAYVEMLGGKIWVESEEGKGSVFYFTIPYLTELKEKKIIKNDIPVKKTKNQIKDLKILIVEDDEISKLLMTIAIKKFAKEVLIASTGPDAIETCRNNPDIDLVMMDINMPEMSGYEATKEIRKFNKDLVIIAQTANGLPNDRDKAMAAGCTDYISKPVNIGSLTELIKKYF